MNITSIPPIINVVSVSNQALPASGRSPAVAKSLISKKSSASTASTSITGVSQQILKFSSRLSVPFSPVREASNLKQSETRNNYIPRFLRNKNNPHGSFFTSWRKREDSNLRDIAAHTISSRAPSTTRPRFHFSFYHTLQLKINPSQQKTPPQGRVFSNNFKYGTPDRIRTYDLLLRKQTLYPAELRVQMWILFKSEDSNNIHLEIK